MLRSNLEKSMQLQVDKATEAVELRCDDVTEIIPSFWEGGLELWLDVKIGNEKEYQRFLWRDEDEELERH